MRVSFGVDTNELSFSATSTTRAVKVSSGKKWDVTSMPEWINLQSISPGHSPYEWTANFSASANDEYNREGIITIKAGSDAAQISVAQEGNKGKYYSVESVSLIPTELTLTEGENTTLSCTISPSNASVKNVTWTTSASSVATVSNNGRVDAVAEGTALITVTTSDGNKTASCAVTVKAKVISVTSVSLDCGSLSMDVGTTHTLVATVSPSNATDKSVSWTSSNTTVATVSSSGMVTARAAGSATITVTTNDGGKMTTCSVSVLDPVELGAVSIKSISFSRAVVSCPISYGHNMVLEKGVCVSTNPSLTPSDNEGVFLAATDEEMLSLVIDGLSQGTTYYVIAFVTTSSDYGRTGSSTTVYTKPVSFTTLTAPNYVVPGLFSVSSTKKVYLASGNLMYKESDEQYHIYDHQYKGKTMLTREQILADHYCAEHKMSLEARMDEIGVPHHQYYRWKKKYRQEDASGTGPA